jgi:hypothetical protein
VLASTTTTFTVDDEGDSSSLEVTVILGSMLTGLLADDELELLRDSGDGDELELEEQFSSNFSTVGGK